MFLTWLTKEGKLEFRSEYNKARFIEYAKKNGPVLLEIKPRQRISQESRGYFEGALVPAYCEWAEKLNPISPEDCDAVRKMFKLEFNGRWLTGLDGEPIKIPQSTKRFSRENFRSQFIEKIVDYFIQNQIPVPNPDLYKKRRDEWANKEPELSFWQFLRKHGLKCDGTQIDLSPPLP